MQSDRGLVGERKAGSLPVFLVGFMGAGKTTVGKELADILGFPFLDLDTVVETRIGRTVREIFEEFGERQFRELESAAIHSCASFSNTVIALGGGAYVSPDNRRLIATIGRSIWLDCPLELCLSRIQGDGSRPLASSEESVRALYRQRRASYSEADLTIQIMPDQSANEIARKIVKLLGL
jgi:shikimate kinase